MYLDGRIAYHKKVAVDVVFSNYGATVTKSQLGITDSLLNHSITPIIANWNLIHFVKDVSENSLSIREFTITGTSGGGLTMTNAITRTITFLIS